MTRIASIEVSHHRQTLDPPFKAAWDGRERAVFDATIVRVRDDEGREGVGSGDLMLGFEGVAGLDHRGLFVGEDPMALERHWEVLSHIEFHYGRCWPLDLALWDLAGKITDQPVWRLLGGRARSVPLYASTGVLRDPGAMAAQAERLVEAGFPAIKLRFTSSAGGRADWRADVAAVEQVRARIGDRVELMVDANQGWRMPSDTRRPWGLKDALAVARALEPLGVYWLEEPLHRADLDGMRRLRDATPIRIAGGEMTRELSAQIQLIEGRCLDVVQADVALVGGITGCRRLALAARAAGVLFTPHSWTNGLGVLANAHLTAGIGDAPFLEFPHDPPDWDAGRRDFLLSEKVMARDGVLTLSDAPGLGAVLDEDRMAATRIG